MNELIPYINKLQDVFSAVGEPHAVNLPQLVIIGSQSAGKSSVIENIVGRDFLPRGTNCVTRRPLILQLKRLESDNGEEWGEFLHRPGQRYFNFEEIRNEIALETDRETKGKSTFSKKPINLQIFSPFVVDLTLVDLPGITKVPIGDQPANVEELVREILLPFIRNPMSIIVAVSPANMDIANSESMKLAKEVDPSGHRTLGVITKIDLMDRGTDCLDVLNGITLPLAPYGYVGVVNRSQKDIIDKKPIDEAIQQEKQFFQNHEVYGRVHSRMGTMFLAKKLNKILLEHIESCLPELENKVSKALTHAQRQRHVLGLAPYTSNEERGQALLKILLQFCQAYADSIDGRSVDVANDRLSGGSSIGHIFRQTFANAISELSPFDNLSDNQIRTAILNAAATRPSLFVTEMTFELLVKQQIIRMGPCCMQCADMVYNELRRVSTQAIAMVPELKRFPNLSRAILDNVRTSLSNHLERTKRMIQNIIDIQLAYIKTTHPEFISGSQAIAAGTVWDQDYESSSGEEDYDEEEDRDGDMHTDSAPEESDESEYLELSLSESRNRSRTNPSSPNPSHNNNRARKSSQHNRNRSHSLSQSQSHNRNHSQSQGPHHAHHRTRSHRRHPSRKHDHSRTASSLQDELTILDSLPPVLQACDVHHSDRSIRETVIIKSLVVNYFDIVRKQVQDAIPKSIMCFLVSNSKSHMQTDLLEGLYKKTDTSYLMEEDQSIMRRREEARKAVDILTKAQTILSSMKGTRMYV